MRILLAVMILCGGCAPQGALDAQSGVMIEDLEILSGDPWEGWLSYLDYSSNRMDRIPVGMRFDSMKKRKMVYWLRYPGETQHNSREQLRISTDGRHLNNEAVISRTQLEDGTVVIITQLDGEDDNQAATIRMTYSLHPKRLEIRKDFRLDSKDQYQERSAYRLTR